MPSVSGGQAVGAKLSCASGAWAGDATAEFYDREPIATASTWTRNGVAIAGATGATMVASKTGTYQCVDAARNQAGLTTSPSPAHIVYAAPNSKIKHATISSRHHTAHFTLKATGKETGFQCRLARRGKSPKFHACHSAVTYKHLKAGHYTFSVRAVGPGGTDKTPAKKKFAIS